MKRAFFLTLLLLCLGVLGVVLVFRTVDEPKDQVTVTETTFYGTPSAASGLTAHLAATLSDRLFWNIACPLDDPAQTETDFRFSINPNGGEIAASAYGGGIDITVPSSSYSMTSSGEIDLSGSVRQDLQGLQPVFRDVASRTNAGESHPEEVFLRDYFSFYPLGVTLNLPGFHCEWYGGVDPGDSRSAIAEQLADYFSIPVREGHRVQVIVTKDSAGRITDLSLSTLADSGLGLWSTSAVTANACYFTLSSYTSDHTPLDVGHIPGGFGLYRLPFTGTGEDTQVLTAQLETVYSLAPGTFVEDLTVTKDGSKLLLLTLENGGHWLTVLDAETVRVLQKVLWLDRLPDEVLGDFYYGDDFFVAFPNSLHFLLVAADKTEAYHPVFTGDASPLYAEDLLPDPLSAIAWNGTRLAIGILSKYSFQPYGFSLAVYDKTGLLYIGRYDTGLTNSWDESAVASFYPAEAPLSLVWESKAAGSPS